MNKTVLKVFMLVGLLVIIFIAWQLIFNDGGIIHTGYEALVDGVNGQWHKVAGNDSDLLPHWTTSEAQMNGAGFDIGTGAGGTN